MHKAKSEGLLVHQSRKLRVSPFAQEAANGELCVLPEEKFVSQKTATIAPNLQRFDS